MKNSGNWSGYFTYAKTTGSKSKFDVQLTFKLEGANKVFVGKGSDDDGEFELLNSIVTDTVVKFKKRYKNEKMKDSLIKYVGRVSGGSAIHGKWWVVGNARRVHGEFYMYYNEYEVRKRQFICSCLAAALEKDRYALIILLKNKLLVYADQ